ncbi:hypothetical protein EYR40_004775 [Pleurotus pulmonarius]|nr:hypothetical protein EYR36_006847 [Pleurotus pulmonarius]KAF4601538.1 hypothetical protein EYR38_006192 [Pleurotus pulmonarius]KAF4601577.1 hypothetical protein EYR40_004775 [Pleurotus pulmonarius]
MSNSPRLLNHPNDLCEGIPHLRSFRLTPQHNFDIEGPQDQDDAPSANCITQLSLRSCGLKHPPYVSNTVTSLFLSLPHRQPYEHFRTMLLSMTSLRTLALSDSLPWLLFGGTPPQFLSGVTMLKDLSAMKPFANSGPRPVYPLRLPSTLRELTVYDHGFPCIQFFASIDCQLTKLEIQCKTDGFNPLSLFKDAARLLLPMPETPFNELLVRSKSEQFIIQCARSTIPHSYTPLRFIPKPALSIAIGFDDDNGETPLSAVYDETLAMALQALPLAGVRRLRADLHIDFKAVWFRGFYHCLQGLQSITLHRGAIDGFVETHLWMAQNDTLIEAIPFTELQAVFADWDSRWARVWGDVDNILRYHNYGGVFPILFNLGKYAEGFVGPKGPQSDSASDVVECKSPLGYVK